MDYTKIIYFLTTQKLQKKKLINDRKVSKEKERERDRKKNSTTIGSKTKQKKEV